jgi:hypothetical protein
MELYAISSIAIYGDYLTKDLINSVRKKLFRPILRAAVRCPFMFMGVYSSKSASFGDIYIWPFCTMYIIYVLLLLCVFWGTNCLRQYYFITIGMARSVHYSHLFGFFFLSH